MSRKKKWPRDARGVKVPPALYDTWIACRKIRTEALGYRNKMNTYLERLPPAGVPMPNMSELVEMVYQGVAISMPYVVCQSCENGDGCETCKYKGWLSKYEFDYSKELSDESDPVSSDGTVDEG